MKKSEIENAVLELENIVAQQQEQIAALEALAPKPAPKKEEFKAAPTPYDRAVAAHAEYVRPYMEEWDEAVSKEVERRKEKFLINSRHTPLPWQIEKMKEDAVRAIPYNGPIADYTDYMNARKKELYERAEHERNAKLEEGLPVGVRRDPTNVPRWTRSGERYIAEEE